MQQVLVEVQKLVGTGGVGTGEQGERVKLTEDGKYLFVTASSDNNNIGAVWFFQYLSGEWTQRQKIVPTGYVNKPKFAFVFTFDGTSWVQQGNKLVGTNYVATPEQGSVALSADGNTALVGGNDDVNGIGAAWVFVRSGSVWSQQGSKLVPTGYVGTHIFLGFAVALASDGNLAIIGGANDGTVTGTGAIWIYLRSGNTWSQAGSKITAVGATGPAYVGWSMALSGDDQTLVVGAINDNSYAGAAFVFKRSGNTFVQFKNKLVGTGAGLYPEQGYSVAVSKQGTFIAVGAPGDADGVGAVFMYMFNGTNYNQLGTKVNATYVIGSANIGNSVALDGTGSQLLFGGPYDDGSIGAAWIYENKAITTSPTTSPTAPTTTPTRMPSSLPTFVPTKVPSKVPTALPTTQPSLLPSTQPITTKPSVVPVTSQPSLVPVTSQPSLMPVPTTTMEPSFVPTTTTTTNFPHQDTSIKPTSLFTSTSSGPFLSLVTVVPVLLLVWCALIYFFFRVYKKQVNNEGNEMKSWIQGNKGEIALQARHFDGNNNNNKGEEEDGNDVAPMNNPLATRQPSTREYNLNV